MPPETADRSERRLRLTDRFPEWGIDALILSDAANIRYLTGFPGTEAAAILTRDRVALLVDGRYTIEARETVRDAEIVEVRDWVEGVASVLAASTERRCGFESDVLTVHAYERLASALGTAGSMLPLSKELSALRAVKDGSELACMRTAALIASEALLGLLPDLRPGLEEREIALELDVRMRRAGAEEISFPTIVASGRHAALPHATPGFRRLEAGDAVVIDYGAVFLGYHSDETCTFFLGQPDDEVRAVYEQVLRAHDLALASLKPGVACRDVDRIARDTLREAGLERYFTHGTGHGVGLDVHEAPRINSRSEAVLEAGMVVTIEPGVYLPGRWGVRIEDMVLIREDGFEILSAVPKTLTLLTGFG